MALFHLPKVRPEFGVLTLLKNDCLTQWLSKRQSAQVSASFRVNSRPKKGFAFPITRDHPITGSPDLPFISSPRSCTTQSPLSPADTPSSCAASTQSRRTPLDRGHADES